MNKEMLKKMKLGIVALSTFGLLAACGNGATTEDPPADDPAVEEPADVDPEMDPEDDADVNNGGVTDDGDTDTDTDGDVGE